MTWVRLNREADMRATGRRTNATRNTGTIAPVGARKPVKGVGRFKDTHKDRLPVSGVEPPKLTKYERERLEKRAAKVRAAE